MKIKLTQRGPVMWFLGNPKNLTVSLTYADPGPVEINFNKLQNSEQQKVLTDIRSGVLESDKDYRKLYNQWMKSNLPVQSEDIKEKKPEVPVKQSRQETHKVEKERDERREIRFRKKCDLLISQNEKALKVGLKGKQHPDLLKLMLQTEKTGKKRKGILSYLENKLKQTLLAQQRKIDKKVAKETKQQLSANGNKETLPLNVVDSEQETVILTPEDLITASMNKY